ncbi:excinuclease ABC subunit UvrC [Desulfurobacterium sp. TC5-1]|uniref:excinuclease ABC subunit UvrC n=1 Tax=Desulfurobacterium sp. TC5-1 TaxID=1158318 RepID=UPI001E522919|nr:excinuclease ABC subunit UvrC [Desulfurobacterium sp. TC5-1]
MKRLEKKLESVPDLPGVYLFHDSNGKVIYVGKARSLKKRIASHIKATDPSDKSYRIVKASSDFDYVVVRNEREALALEAELIKKHLPKYNVLMKDDKSYPFLLITDEPFPSVRLVRKTDNTSGRRFGPFIPAKNARLTMDLIHRLFRLRKCRELKKRERPCIQYHMERCCAPCCGYVSKKEYMEQVKGAISFLEGNVKAYLQSLYEHIEALAQRQEFERAAFLRDQFVAIKNLYEKYAVFMDEYKDCDIFYLEEKGGFFEGIHIIVRHGIIMGRENFSFDPFEPWDTETVRELFSGSGAGIDVIGSIWLKNYFENREVPPHIFANFVPVNLPLNVKPISEEMFKVVLQNKKREKLHLNIDFEALSSEYESVFMDSFPERVEVFDISTLQGEATVASCVVWEKGRFVKKDYRRYRIKTVSGINDYASMEEVLTRRFRSIKEGKVKMPSLILIDGGVGQLNVAIRIKELFGLPFRVFSIAKREEIIYTDEGEVVETRKYPYLFRFFTVLRDEAHRFAITYNRHLRSKKLKKSIFDDVKGLGMKRRRIVEKFYPDIKELATVTVDELKQIGIPEKVAYRLIEKVREVYGE